jgi:tetratricopeptide (TPR) repeat protein
MFSLFSTIPADEEQTKPIRENSKIPQVVAIVFLIFIWLALMSFGGISMLEPQWLHDLSTQGKYQEAKDYKNMGDNLLRQGNFNLGIGHYVRALEIKPDYVDARVNLGVALGYVGRPDEAIATLQAGLEMDPPTESVIYFNLAKIAKEQGDTLRAFEYYQQTLADDPDPEYTLVRLGMLYEHHLDWGEAYDCFRSAVNTQMDVRSTYRSMLMRSIPHYQRPVDSLHLKVLEEQLAAGVTRAMMAPYDTTLIRQLLDRSNLSTALTHMGITSIAQELPVQAAIHFEQAIQVKPDNVEAAGMLRQLRGNSTP